MPEPRAAPFEPFDPEPPVSRGGSADLSVAVARRWPAVLGERAAKALLGGALLFVMIVVSRRLGAPLFFASWASSLALLITAPHSDACRPFRVFFSHATAMIVGLAANQLFPGAPWAVGAAVAVAMLVAMTPGGLHPPAIANAAFAFSTSAPPGGFFLAGALGSVFLAALAICLRRTKAKSTARISSL